MWGIDCRQLSIDQLHYGVPSKWDSGPANTPEFISVKGSIAGALKALFGLLSAPRVPLTWLLCGSFWYHHDGCFDLSGVGMRYDHCRLIMHYVVRVNIKKSIKLAVCLASGVVCGSSFICGHSVDYFDVG